MRRLVLSALVALLSACYVDEPRPVPPATEYCVDVGEPTEYCAQYFDWVPGYWELGVWHRGYYVVRYGYYVPGRAIRHDYRRRYYRGPII